MFGCKKSQISKFSTIATNFQRKIKILFIANPGKYGGLINQLHDCIPNQQSNIEKILITQDDELYKNPCQIKDPESINSICILNSNKEVLEKIDLKVFSGLEWIQLVGVGFNVIQQLTNLTRNKDDDKQVVITNLKGAPSQALAEFGILVCLYFFKHLPKFKQFQNNKLWAQNQFSLHDIQSIYNKKILIIGLGDIGLTFSRFTSIHKPLSIVGLKKSMHNRDQLLAENSQIEEIDVLSEQSLKKHLPESDIIYMSLPGHPSLENVLNRSTLSYVKNEAIVINVGRGLSIDEEALIESIKTKNIKVGLDVTKSEPYDQEYLLLNDPSIQDNVILTSHSVDLCNVTLDNYKSIFLQNIHNYQNNQPLINQINLAKGY